VAGRSRAEVEPPASGRPDDTRNAVTAMPVTKASAVAATRKRDLLRLSGEGS
jgi:hypothetical protein